MYLQYGTPGHLIRSFAAVYSQVTREGCFPVVAITQAFERGGKRCGYKIRLLADEL